jgi:hypothetical protein
LGSPIVSAICARVWVKSENARDCDGGDSDGGDSDGSENLTRRDCDGGLTLQPSGGPPESGRGVDAPDIGVDAPDIGGTEVPVDM